ncbi:MAG: glycosyltransferase [Muribaculaceae bacterium]|nr:glycosyltransferase [Muribaculaceae bacterium]
MRKKILINIHYLEIGGAESSLIGLLHSLDSQKLSVDLMLYDRRGEMLQYVPDWVNIIDVPKAYSMIEVPIRNVIKKGYWGIAFARIWAKLKFYLYNKKNHPKEGSAIFGYVGKYVTPFLPSLKKLGEYDLAVSYLTPHNIVLEKVKAKKKICWIHTDYSSIDVNKKLEFPVWNGYDIIVSISEKVTESFCYVFPELKEKIIKIGPILSREIIERRSMEFIPEDMKKKGDELLILSIGRYCYAKNFESIPQICRILLDKGINLKWYIIGYGASDNYIKDEIKKNNIENRVIVLGKKENPYPYIRACDYYVQPSRYEGNSITVKEAQILGKPVIITNYPTATSQIEKGVDGFIGPIENDKFAAYFADLWINRQDKIAQVKNKLVDFDLYGLENISKFYYLVDMNSQNDLN